MDALTLAQSFAAIVGLLVNFQSVHNDPTAKLDDFIEWLKETRHEDVAAAIENNAELQNNLTNFMSQNHSEIMAQLSQLNDLMVSIASHIKGLGGIAQSFEVDHGLSDQAIDVLRQFVESEANQAWRLESMDGELDFIIGHGSIDYTDKRFIDDDFDNLVELGLLRLDYSSDGDKVFCLTRKAVNFIESIDHN